MGNVMSLTRRLSTLSTPLLALPLMFLACSGEDPPLVSTMDSGSGGAQNIATGGEGPAMTGGTSPIAAGGTGGTSATASGGSVGQEEPVDDGACTSGSVDSRFKLKWQDDFDTFDEARWKKNTHTFPENLAQFAEDAVVTEDGYLKLHLTRQQTGDKQFRGGEVMTREEFQYGRFDVCARWGEGRGVVGSFFTYVYGPWNEIDIEYLGVNPVGVQYNLIWDHGEGTGLNYKPHFDPTMWNGADAFHHYAFEWTPGEVKFFVDGELRHIENGADAAALTRAVTLRMNLWPTNEQFAAGPQGFDESAAPTESWYDWVRVYDYAP